MRKRTPGHLLLFGVMIFSSAVLRPARGDDVNPLAPTTTKDTSLNSTESITQLKIDRTRLQSELKDGWAAAYRADPLLTFSESFPGLDNSYNYSIKVIYLWLDERRKTDPTTSAKVITIYDAARLYTIVSMLEEPHGKIFVRSGIDVLFRPEGGVFDKAWLINEMKSRFSDLHDSDLNSATELWNALQAKAPVLRKSLQQEISDFPKVYNWPQNVVTGLKVQANNYVRSGIYPNYEEMHTPKKLQELSHDLAQVNQKLALLTAHDRTH